MTASRRRVQTITKSVIIKIFILLVTPWAFGEGTSNLPAVNVPAKQGTALVTTCEKALSARSKTWLGRIWNRSANAALDKFDATKSLVEAEIFKPLSRDPEIIETDILPRLMSRFDSADDGYPVLNSRDYEVVILRAKLNRPFEIYAAIPVGANDTQVKFSATRRTASGKMLFFYHPITDRIPSTWTTGESAAKNDIHRTLIDLYQTIRFPMETFPSDRLQDISTQYKRRLDHSFNLWDDQVRNGWSTSYVYSAVAMNTHAFWPADVEFDVIPLSKSNSRAPQTISIRASVQSYSFEQTWRPVGHPREQAGPHQFFNPAPSGAPNVKDDVEVGRGIYFEVIYDKPIGNPIDSPTDGPIDNDKPLIEAMNLDERVLHKNYGALINSIEGIPRRLKLDPSFIRNVELGGETIDVVRFLTVESGEPRYYFFAPEQSPVKSYRKKNFGPLAALDIRPYLQAGQTRLEIGILGETMSLNIELASGLNNHVATTESDRDQLLQILERVKLLSSDGFLRWIANGDKLHARNGELFRESDLRIKNFTQDLAANDLTDTELIAKLDEMKSLIGNLNGMLAELEVRSIHEEMNKIFVLAKGDPRILEGEAMRTLMKRVGELLSYRDYILKQMLLTLESFRTEILGNSKEIVKGFERTSSGQYQKTLISGFQINYDLFFSRTLPHIEGRIGLISERNQLLLAVINNYEFALGSLTPGQLDKTSAQQLLDNVTKLMDANPSNRQVEPY